MQPLDPQAVALAKAIRETESGGDWNAQGASGEFGAYQFMPATWQAYAGEAGVQAPFGSATPEQQNEVAYKKIKQWKDQGYNPGQIASMWNAGPGKPNAYIEGNKGVNSKGVEYDTKTYAEKVAQSYQRLKGQTAVNDVAPQPEEPKTFLQEAGGTLAEAGNKLAGAVGSAFSGEINPLSGLIQSAGAIAGGIGGVANDALRHLPVVGGLVRGTEDLIGKGVTAAAETDLGQDAIKAYSDFAEKHPELAGNIEAGVDIASAVPVLKGFGIAKNTVKGGLDTALRGSKDAVLETVGKNLTPKKMADAVVKRGTEKRGLLGEVRIKPDPFEVKIADAVKQNVPKFNPSKPLLNNIDETKKVVTTMAKTLKEKVNEVAKDRIYSYRELGSMLNKLEVPDVIAAEPYLMNLHKRLVDHAIRIAKEKGGKIPNLIDVRQEFDSLVRKQYPNIYSSIDRTSPLKETVKNIRDALTDFTVKNLPEGAGLRESYLVQHQLLRAVENMAEKASKGATKEIGTDALGRLKNRHPILSGLVKTGAQATAQGAGIGGVMKILD